MLANFVLGIQEFNWNQRCRDKKTNLKICLQVLTPSTQGENWSFHVVERTRATAKWKNKNEKCTCKAWKSTVFIHLLNMQICEILAAVVVRRACLSSLKSDP